VGEKPSKRRNVRRGSASSHRVIPACSVRTRRVREPLKSRLEQASSWPMAIPTTKTTRRAGNVERRAGYRRGKNSEGGSPGALPA
jgi:hypothetical protein